MNRTKMEVKVKIDDKNGGWIYKDYPVSEIRFKKGNQPIEKEDEDDDLIEE